MGEVALDAAEVRAAAPEANVAVGAHEVLRGSDDAEPGFIEPNAAKAGGGRITLAVTGLDALLERLAAEGIEHEPIETYSSGVRHVWIPDPDGNAIAFAEPPEGTSARPPGPSRLRAP